jgi:hypothetical protein
MPPVSLAFLSSCRSYDANYLRGDCSLTQATDTTNIRLVFAAAKETILQNALKDSRILRYAFRLCFSAGKSCVRVFYQILWSDVGNAQVFSSCPRISLLVLNRGPIRLRISGASSSILNRLAIRHRATSSSSTASVASTDRFLGR